MTIVDVNNDREAEVAITASPSLIQLGRQSSVVQAELNERVDLPITGMTCVACAMHIQGQLAKVPGVHNAGVNFAMARATVNYDPRITEVPQLIEAVRSAGYGAMEMAQSGVAREEAEETFRRSEYADLKRKFWIAAFLSAPVLLIAMSHGRISVLNFPGVNWLQFALTTIVIIYGGGQFYRGAWSAFRHRSTDMNTLISVGTGAAYLYSAAATIAESIYESRRPGLGRTEAPARPEASGKCSTSGKCSKRYTRRKAQPYILIAVIFCPYCGQRAAVDIPSTPWRVCLTHALEFWTGLLAYVKDRSDPSENQEVRCTCRLCIQLSLSNARSVPAVAVTEDHSDSLVPVNADPPAAAHAPPQ